MSRFSARLSIRWVRLSALTIMACLACVRRPPAEDTGVAPSRARLASAATVLDSLPGLAVGAQRDCAGFELFYPGVGHAPDNIVVYFASARVLFGGCLIKPDTATTVGNVADADVAKWPGAVARVAAHFPAARVVVPGHGAVSGRGALSLTETLIAEKGPAAVEALRRRSTRP